ncbi:MAG TPA: hypothetical protein VF420_04035 [Casimicrobiaceae bacterium]
MRHMLAIALFCLAAALSCDSAAGPLQIEPSTKLAQVQRAAEPAPAASQDIVVPPNALYVCVTVAGGVRTQTEIEFAQKVAQLCASHPEMGPCQYERNACRRGGGRVYAAGGKEITMATEAEYDKKVLRVQLKQ